MRTRVKFCGCTSARDALLAVEAGADAIGFTFAASPRQIALDSAAKIAAELPPFVTPAGIFVDPSREQVIAALNAIPNLVVQLSGYETPEFVRDIAASAFTATVIHVDPAQVEFNSRELIALAQAYQSVTIMFDTKIGNLAGGTGVTFAWEIIAPIARERRIGVAGGLTPENVGECIRTVRPYFVDVRTGIETDGKKDSAKMQAFINAVREADEALTRSAEAPARSAT